MSMRKNRYPDLEAIRIEISVRAETPCDANFTAPHGCGRRFCISRLLGSLLLLFLLLPPFSHPAFAASAEIYRGNIRLAERNIQNLALQYPIVLINGSYYLPLTEEFSRAFGYEVAPYTLQYRSHGDTQWAYSPSIVLTETEASELPDSAFEETVDLTEIVPLVTAVFNERGMIRSNLPLYAIGGIAYFCPDDGDDIRGQTANILKRGTDSVPPVDLPEFFSVFEKIKKEDFVRNQGTAQTCWAFAANSALEIKIALETGKTMNFSETHLISHCPVPSSSSSGGNWRGSAAYFTRGIGPVVEREEDARHDGNVLGADWISSDLNGDSGKHPATTNRTEQKGEQNRDSVRVTEFREIGGADAIKRAILKNGAVLTSIYFGSMRQRYYNGEHFAYYHDNRNDLPTHELLLIGWDDHFPAARFKETPPTDGAFIAMNSFGTNFGDGGLFYISYADDLALKRAVTIDKIAFRSEASRILSTDRTGVTHFEPSAGRGRIYAVAKLKKDGETGQRIRGVGVFSGGEALVSAYFCPQRPEREDQLTFLGDAYFREPGYKMIDSFYNVLIPDTFYIVLKYTSTDRFVIPVEAPYPGIDYPIAAEPGVNFIAYEDRGKLILTPLESDASVVVRLLVE